MSNEGLMWHDGVPQVGPTALVCVSETVSPSAPCPYPFSLVFISVSCISVVSDALSLTVAQVPAEAATVITAALLEAMSAAMKGRGDEGESRGRKEKKGESTLSEGVREVQQEGEEGEEGEEEGQQDDRMVEGVEEEDEVKGGAGQENKGEGVDKEDSECGRIQQLADLLHLMNAVVHIKRGAAVAGVWEGGEVRLGFPHVTVGCLAASGDYACDFSDP